MSVSSHSIDRRTFVTGAAVATAVAAVAAPAAAQAGEAASAPEAPVVTGEATPGYVCTIDWLG